MATQALRQLRLFKTAAGSQECDKIALATGATMIPGDILLKTDNKVDIAGADPSVISYYSQGTSTDVVPGETKLVVTRIHSSDQFAINAYHTTAANATVPDTALDGQANYGIARQTVSGVTAWVLDLEDTSATRVRLLERLDPAADLYPRCVVQFLPANLTFD